MYLTRFFNRSFFKKKETLKSKKNQFKGEKRKSISLDKIKNIRPEYLQI